MLPLSLLYRLEEPLGDGAGDLVAAAASGVCSRFTGSTAVFGWEKFGMIFLRSRLCLDSMAVLLKLSNLWRSSAVLRNIIELLSMALPATFRLGGLGP